jgi:hypothetical protein
MCRDEWQQRSAHVWRAARFGAEKKKKPEMRTVEESTKLYEQALSEAGRIAGFGVSRRGFEDSRQKVFSEVTEFLEIVGFGLDVDTATDLDVITFVQGHWLPKPKANYRTQMGSDGSEIASASAIKGVIQQLAKSYSMLGRKDTDNPAKQESVIKYCEDYRNWLRCNGVKEKRAKVFKEKKVDDLVKYLEQRIVVSSGLRKCLLLMDLPAIDYLWESWARGKECGELGSDEVDFEDGVAEPGWSKMVR